MMRIKIVNRSRKGNFIVDTPIALFVFFFFFVFPFVDIATVTLRTTFLYAATHNAAWESARAHSYQTSLDNQPSTMQLAEAVARKTASSFSGIKINSVQTSIVATDLKTLKQTRQTARLTTPADQSLNSYQIEVAVNGDVSPLITYSNNHALTKIPGLTEPMNLTFTDRQFCENPQGLTK